MPAVEVRKGIAMPGSLRMRYPWHQMCVGDSFVVSSSVSNPHSAVVTANRRLKPKKFICRRLGDGSYGI